MHELGLTTDMIEAISERMLSYPGRRVTRVVLEVGKLAAVLPDAMRFCFDLCSRGTPVEGATLEVVEIPAVGACRRCTRRLVRESPLALCECGSAELDWDSGNELRIREMELD